MRADYQRETLKPHRKGQTTFKMGTLLRGMVGSVGKKLLRGMVGSGGKKLLRGMVGSGGKKLLRGMVGSGGEKLLRGIVGSGGKKLPTKSSEGKCFMTKNLQIQ